MAADPLIEYVTVRVREDSVFRVPEEWRADEYIGFSIGAGYPTGQLTVWIDWEAIPRLCHLLTELYRERPGQEPAPHTLAERHCDHCGAVEGAPHVYPCPILALAEDR